MHNPWITVSTSVQLRQIVKMLPPRPSLLLNVIFLIFLMKNYAVFFPFFIRKIIFAAQKVPVIEIYPSESQVVDVGQRVALDCRVLAGSPKPNLQWIRRDLKAFSYRISVQQLSWRSASLLIIRDITEEEAGQYECVASNVAGKVSKVISIIVREPKPTISIWPNVKQMNVTEGTQLALYCGVDASTQMDIKWYGPNTANSRNEFLPNGIVLHKHNVSRSDGGIYICRVSNKSGTQRKQIKVLVQPKLSMNEKP